MGDVTAARNPSISRVLDIMAQDGLDEESAMKKMIDLGIRDYVAALFKEGEISVREAAEILQMSCRQTLEILTQRVGGDVTSQEVAQAIDLARRLSGRG